MANCSPRNLPYDSVRLSSLSSSHLVKAKQVRSLSQKSRRWQHIARVDILIWSSCSNILPWVTNNQGSDTRRGVGIVLLNLIGQCGPLLGTNVFPKSEGTRYVKGMAICAAFIWFTGVLAVSLRLLLVWENKKLDKKYGTRAAIIASRTGDAAGHESVQSEENYGETFRYIL